MIETITPSSRAKWLDLRKSTLGASEVAALLGAHPWLTPYKLWAEKSGILQPVEETRSMRRGRYLEGVAVDFLREEQPLWIVTPNIPGAGGKFYRDTESRLSCTRDVFVRKP
jgi:hypothetical protein